MAVLFADPGGEYYFSLGATAPGIWSSNNGATLVNNAPAGALTTYAIQLGGSNSGVFRTLTSNYVTLIFGGRYYVPNGFTVNNILLAAFDAATAQSDVRVDASGHLFVTRNGTTLGTSTNALVTNSGWHYIEFIITIGPASAGNPNGAAEVWVDGVQWLVLTGVNTKNSANQFASRVQFGSVTNALASYWKDMYIVETTGGTVITRRGDRQVSIAYDSGAGTNQQWSNTGGASQTASVQDGRSHSGTWPDGDTSYISDSVPGHISDFAHDALTVGSIDARIHVSYMRSDAGTAGAAQVTLSGASMRTAPAVALGNTYNYFFDVMELDPDTGLPWILSGFNAATDGVLIPGMPDEDFWRNSVAPIANKHYVNLPLGDPDEILA